MLAEYIQYKYIYSTDTCFPLPSARRAHRHPPTAIYPRIVGRIYPIQVYIFSWHHLPMPMLPSSITTQYNYFVIYIIVSHMFLNRSSFCFGYGVKLSSVSNCPRCQIVRCQIVLGSWKGVKKGLVTKEQGGESCALPMCTCSVTLISRQAAILSDLRWWLNWVIHDDISPIGADDVYCTYIVE